MDIDSINSDNSFNSGSDTSILAILQSPKSRLITIANANFTIN
ncbi:hypothetical protein ABIC84_004686 [Mucilaginibacter sp. 3215]